ncbi:MAG: GNAT family N-acetyltransferase [Hyphomicrobiaceae bacterium]|nr:MAG: GNAT family N-acetyltransferase [Hyphomicrobiaceae bacterium]
MSKLETERLSLRPFRRTDAPAFTRLAGDWAVASMTSDIPFPFVESQAAGWLEPARGEVRFAIEREGRLIGGVGYYRRASGVAELGFWLGRAWWGRGYATEAAEAVVRRGLRDRSLPGFSSAHFIDNPASGRVLAKLGFEPTGRGLIACEARGCDVEVVTYRLDRKRASIVMPALATEPASRPRWRAWLSLFGAS